jgi:hypothetical protein
MNKRHAFVVDSLDEAKRCVSAARRLGLADDAISVVARSDSELQPLPDDLHEASPMDTVPAAVRGLAGGGATGLLLGLVAAAIPGLGVTLGGAALIGVLGASIGTWSASLMGSAIPNEVRRELEDSIAAGKLVVVLDVEEEHLPAIDAQMTSLGARKADYESTSVVS